jgi:hypothetical protein
MLKASIAAASPRLISFASGVVAFAGGFPFRFCGLGTRRCGLTVELQNGRERTYDPRRQKGVSVSRQELRRFSEGDRIEFTAPANDLKALT